MSAPLLSVRELTVTFATREGPLRALREVSFDLNSGETLAVVGESGAGKSVLVRSLMGLPMRSPSHVTGAVVFKGVDLVAASADVRRGLWGLDVAMIFQDPTAALNPVLRVGKQIDEILRVRRGFSRRAAKERAIELLDLVGIASPSERYDAYPGQLSGGTRQRVVIATALAGEPSLLLADEPTTGLDVSVQAQLLDLLDELQRQLHMGLVLVTHDLAVAAARSTRVVVLYAGRVVESGPTDVVLAHPAMPYSGALLAASPRLHARPHTALAAIPGTGRSARRLAAGCPFAPRCPRATDRCHVDAPTLEPLERPDHYVACWHPLDGPDRP